MSVDLFQQFALHDAITQTAGTITPIGVWSVAGWAPAEGTGMTGGAYPDWYEFLMANYYKSYHEAAWGTDFRRDDLLPLLTGAEFDAEVYASLAARSGAKYLVPFARHHGGWTMWESRFTRRNAVEMGPGRDIYKELAAACRTHALKLGLYFSISEWEYPAILDRPINGWDSATSLLGTWKNELTITNWRPDVSSFYSAEMNGVASGKIPVRDYFSDYLMPLFKEAVDAFDPDLVWFDGGWNTTSELNRSCELSAYFYNRAEGRKSVVINDRASLSRSPHGDYRTREYNSGQGESSDVRWEICRSISPAFGYNWQDSEANCLSSEDLVRMLVKVVSENGNLLLVIGPDGTGHLPEIQRERLVDLGLWLRRNGEGIYGTRPLPTPNDGDTYFTRSKDGALVYIYCLTHPGEALRLRDFHPVGGTEIRILGSEQPVSWVQVGADVDITLPPAMQTTSIADFGVVMRVRVR